MKETQKVSDPSDGFLVGYIMSTRFVIGIYWNMAISYLVWKTYSECKFR